MHINVKFDLVEISDSEKSFPYSHLKQKSVKAPSTKKENCIR